RFRLDPDRSRPRHLLRRRGPGRVLEGRRRRRRLTGSLRSRGSILRAAGILVGFGLLCSARLAQAEAAPNRARSGAYYAVNAAVMAGLLGGSVLLRLAPAPEPGADPQWFPGDASVRENCSPAAVELSNVTVALTLSAPVFAELARGLDYRLLNAGVVYGETLSANLALNSLVKVLVARPRPY